VKRYILLELYVNCCSMWVVIVDALSVLMVMKCYIIFVPSCEWW